MTPTEKKALVKKVEIAVGKIGQCLDQICRDAPNGAAGGNLILHARVASEAARVLLEGLRAAPSMWGAARPPSSQLPPLEALGGGAPGVQLDERATAQLLGCSLSCLQRWRREGKAPAHTWERGNRGLRYKLSDIEAWKEARRRYVAAASKGSGADDEEKELTPEAKAEIAQMNEKERIWQETHNNHNLGGSADPSIEVPIDLEDDDAQQIPPEGFLVDVDEIDDQ